MAYAARQGRPRVTTPHLTPAQARHIEDYMRRALEALRLNAWVVEVSPEPAEEHANMSIFPTDGRRIATLCVSPDWWDRQTPADKRIDITHEALHLAHHDVEAGIRIFLANSGDIAEYPASIVLERFRLDLERMVDALSYTVAALIPEWTDPTRDHAANEESDT